MNLKNIQRSAYCLNCNTKLTEDSNYCQNCGQLNNVKKETAIGLLRELIGDFLHLDSKVMGSILPLVFRPGYVTKEYLSGKRARFLHPVRLFISLTIVMLITASLTSNKDNNLTNVVDVKNDSSEVVSAENDSSNLTIEFSNVKVPYDEIKKLIKAGVTDQDMLLDTFHIEKKWMNRFAMAQVVKTGKMGWENIKDYISHKMTWILFLLMPVFSGILWLIYSRRKIWFVDHLIFSFHQHAATFLLVTLMYIFALFSEMLSDIVQFMIPLHFVIAQKTVYSQSWIKTIVKSIMIGILYAIIGFIFVLATIALIFILM